MVRSSVKNGFSMGFSEAETHRCSPKCGYTVLAMAISYLFDSLLWTCFALEYQEHRWYPKKRFLHSWLEESIRTKLSNSPLLPLEPQVTCNEQRAWLFRRLSSLHPNQYSESQHLFYEAVFSSRHKITKGNHAYDNHSTKLTRR